MRTEIIRSSSGEEVVVTNDELQYIDVLINGFCESKEIIIFTYNIDNDMISKLRKLSGEIIVHLVINNITFNKLEMFKTLHPRNFNCKLNVYFCVLNHAKLILTDKHFYFGSANFTESSKNNIEIGTITKTTSDLVEKLKKVILNVSRVSAMIGYPDLLIQDKIETLQQQVPYSVYNNLDMVDSEIDDIIYDELIERKGNINSLLEILMGHIDIIEDDALKIFLESLQVVLEEVDEDYPETWDFENEIDNEKLHQSIEFINTQKEFINNKINGLSELNDDVENVSEIDLEDIGYLLNDIIIKLEEKVELLTNMEETLEELSGYLETPSIESKREKARMEVESKGFIVKNEQIIYLPNEKIIEEIDFSYVNPHLKKEEVRKKLSDQFAYFREEIIKYTNQ
ncbi:phospholipase D-like domain-containing protein [Paenibacillus sp. LPE1-1-1.1]|uniref:phospholipase D-like domain-containing protein n=1 Tax=Paenibacillus sp. LPE1-1-1.1 TaxID=3135230 RepID=UPI0034317722